MSIPLEQFGIDRLSASERLHLIDLLWDSIPDDVPYAPLQWHVDELERRLAATDANPGAVEPRESMYARLSRN